MTIELTPELAAEYFAKHLNEPVGTDHSCPLREVLKDNGIRAEVGVASWEFIAMHPSEMDARYPLDLWAECFVAHVDETYTSPEDRDYSRITGAIALAILDECVEEQRLLETPS